MSAIRTNSNRAEARKKRSLPYGRRFTNFLLRPFGYIAVEDVEDLVERIVADTIRENVNEVASTSENVPTPHDSSIRQSNANGSRDPLAIANSVNIAQSEPSSVSQASKPESYDADLTMDVDNTAHSFAFTYSAPGSSSFSTLAEAARNDTPTTTPRKRLAKNPNGSYRWEGAGSAKNTRRNRHGTPAFGASPSKNTRDHTPLPPTPLDNKRRKVDEEGAAGSRQSASNPTTNGVSVPFPASTPPRANGMPKPAPLPSSRLRTPAKPTTPVNPSPLRHAWSDSPSPSSSRDEVAPSSSHPSKQTKTANFMAELIKETTPVKKPDLSNPYQTANPVGKIGPPRRGTKRTRATGKPSVPAKEQQTSENKKEETQEKSVKEYSAQEIIEATLPKGSKRSRPPAHFEKRSSSSEEATSGPVNHREPPVIVETRKQVYIVEEPDEDEDDSARAPKKAKPSANANDFSISIPPKSTTSSKPEITVEEIEEDVVMGDTGKGKAKEMDLPKAPTPASNVETGSSSNIPNSPTSRSPFGVKPSSIPKEPSKLRFSFQAETSSAPPSPAPPAAVPQTPTSLPKPEFKISPPSGAFSFTCKADPPISPTSQPEPIKEKRNTTPDVETAKMKVRAVDSSSLPQFVFTLITTSIPSSADDHVKAQNMVKALPGSSLPSFELGSAKTAEPFSFNYDPSKAKQSPPHTFRPSPPKTGGFAFSMPSVPSSGFIFGSQTSKTTTPAAAPSTVIDLDPVPPMSSMPRVPSTGFSFGSQSSKTTTPAASGVSLPSVPSTGFTFGSQASTTTTPAAAPSTAVILNSAPSVMTPTTAESSSTTAPPSVGFNYAAAGMAINASAAGKWRCSVCGLLTPDSASNCGICDQPRPN